MSGGRAIRSTGTAAVFALALAVALGSSAGGSLSEISRKPGRDRWE